MKQLTNDVITPLNWGKKIEAVRNRLGIHQIDLCIEAGIIPYTYQKIKREEGRGTTACCDFWHACAAQWRKKNSGSSGWGW